MATKAVHPAHLNSGAKKRIRKLFGNIHEAVEMPNLIEVQRESYEQFLRSDPATGYVSGLEKTLRSVFRSEEHTSELQSLMRISYAVFCLKKKKYITQIITARMPCSQSIHNTKRQNTII